MPEIIGGDATARFFSERGNREADEFINIPASYIAMAAELVLTGRRCLEPSKNEPLSENHEVVVFCSRYRKLQAELDGHFSNSVFNPFPAAQTGLAYDGAKLLLTAAQELEPVFNRLGLVLKLTEMTYHGVTAEISFTGSQIAEGQTMAILRFDDIHDVDSNPDCLQAIGAFHGKQHKNGCPTS